MVLLLERPFRLGELFTQLCATSLVPAFGDLESMSRCEVTAAESCDHDSNCD
jgi:hypothetical protein